MAYNRFLGQNGFRGVDFTSHPSLVHPDRLADALNVWKDYKSGQGSAIETFPGFRQIFNDPIEEGEIYGIFRFLVNGVNYLIIHKGELLWYRKEDVGSDFTKMGNSDNYSVCVMHNHTSMGFQFGDKFYIIDGSDFYRIFEDEGKLKAASIATSEADAYIPTTFINGVEHEQRNMLSTYEKQEYGPISISGAFGGYEFEFTEFSDEYMTCSVSGIKSNSGSYSTLVVPSTAIYNKKEYTVTRICKDAFEHRKEILSVLLPESIIRIDLAAFYECTNLRTVYWPASDKRRFINKYSFEGCSSLESVYVGYGSGDNSLVISPLAFNGVDKSVCKIYKYAPTGTESKIIWSDYAIIGEEKLEEIVITDDPFQYVDDISIPIFSPCKDVKEVWLGTTELLGNTNYGITVTTPKDTNENILSVNFSGANLLTALGQTVRLVLQSNPSMFYSSQHASFLSDQSGYGGTAQEAILNCTICTQFDGRVFFTGNPHLPNTVFYTQRDNTGHNNPFYVGVYNYFDTGIGETPNTAMVATGSNLVVFKSDTVQDGAINLYQGVDGTDNILPRFYVRQQGLAGVGCLGAACNFADDLVFISKRGLDAVGLQTVNLERTVQHRSTNVDRRLAAEDLKNACLTEWEGYLVALVPGGKIYLADSRQLFTNKAGHVEYEWYYLNGIGAYKGDEFAYVYSSAFPPSNEEVHTDIDGNEFMTIEGVNVYLHENPDTPVPSSILLEEEGLPPVKSQSYSYTVKYGEGETAVEEEKFNIFYYLEQNGKNYLVYTNNEKIGGTVSPATCIVGFDEYLLFGTKDGTVCVFNTDKRGTMPSNVSEDDIPDYKTKYADIIPREYFTHMGHRYTSAIYLAQENAGVPNMAKNTVKRSVVIKAKDIFGSIFKWNVKTDRQPFGDVAEIATAMPDLSALEFSAFLFDTSYDGAIIALNEKKKRYVEKQYAFFSDGFCRPFGIYHISYQYEIQGKVKNR